MPLSVERSLFRTGESLAVTLPKAWTRYFKLRAGDRVEIVVGDDLVVVIKGKGVKRKVETSVGT